MANSNNKLSYICPVKLNETYETLYEQQQKLGISDDYLLSTSRGTADDQQYCQRLHVLLESSKNARDNLITWYLKQTFVELNVTISLLTAKIKFIEYKLGLCDGLDLHQACSLSLVNFCNILSDLTVVNVSPQERKTMHKVSADANIPIWLSHYRNQICHVPSESPCITILVALVVKSLNYLKDTFWSKVLESDAFDVQKFKLLIGHVSKLTHVTSMNKRLRLKKGVELGKRQIRLAEQNLAKYSKCCLRFRRILLHDPRKGMDIFTRFMITYEFQDSTRNFALLLEQIIYAKCFEMLVFKLVSLAEEDPTNKNIISWLRIVISLISLRKRDRLRETLNKMELSASIKIKKYTDIPPIKCCHIVNRLMKLDGKFITKLIVMLRHKLLPMLGRHRTLVLMKLTTIACGLNET